ncbi:DUF4369 domain-containing protein [Lutibacter sp.]|uniref:DUF4369 domain-containing protein n=1 Tax=Lutibacter sp. TaxID=1925666 RepID=UPI00273371FB|nr:DUF4369 domain-containing protein [Lutibacter sp.]MDP3312228.1 DUF4369 domain-containing protein [Lutibacter sp.]
MKKLISLLTFVVFIISCQSDSIGNMIVTGKIEGLKKGTLYLQKQQDTVVISVDSMQMDGSESFKLSDQLENPEMYYLTLNNNEVEQILFFGEAGEITITSKLSKFATAAKITGSKNQLLFEEHKAMIQKFNGKQLDLFKEKFDAQKSNNTELALQLAEQETNLIKKKYLYSTNFAVNNADYEVAAFVALSELYNANVKLLDTINNSLSAKVKKSKYGVELNKFIKTIKASE